MKASCTLELENQVCVNDLNIGDMGRDSQNRIWLRTYFSIVCLSDIGKTYSSTSTSCPAPSDLRVIKLEKGERVILEQE